MHPLFKKNWSKDLIPFELELNSDGKKEVAPRKESRWKNGESYTKFPLNSIGMRTGSMTANVIDVDTKDLTQLTEPFKSWVEERLMLEDTLTVESKNGYHFYFYSFGKPILTTAKEGADKSTVPFIDFRGEGGIIFIHSDTDFADYKVICDDAPTGDISEILDALPEYVERATVEEVGFENLDDPDDTGVTRVGNKKSFDEVVAMINELDAGIPRIPWLGLMASAYNLIDTDPERLKEPLREWSSKAKNFNAKKFDADWLECKTGKFGKGFKGGTLVKKAREAVSEHFFTEVENATDKDVLEEIAKRVRTADMRQDGKKDNDVRAELLDKLVAKSIALGNKPEKVKWRKALEKEHKHIRDNLDFPDVMETKTGTKILGTLRNLNYFVENHSKHNFKFDVILKRVVVNNDYSLATGISTINRSKLFDELTRVGVVADRMLSQHFEAMCFNRSINPLLAHVENLGEWDGTDYIAQVADTLTTTVASKEYVYEVLKSFSIQAIAAWDEKARTPHQLSRLESVMVFVGKQGGGKTTWVGNLMPKFMRHYFKDGVELNPQDKDSYIEAVQAGLVELGELDATTSKSDISSLKAFLSKLVDEFRAPYGRSAERYTRQTVFVGTVNNPDFLKDTTGSRRFLTLDVAKITLPSAEIVEGMWMQALNLYLNGADWRLPEKFIGERDEVNKRFTDVGASGDVALQFVEAIKASVLTKHRFSVTRILKEVWTKGTPNARERSDFISSLQHHGYNRNAEGKYYLPSDVFDTFRAGPIQVEFDDLDAEEL